MSYPPIFSYVKPPRSLLSALSVIQKLANGFRMLYEGEIIHKFAESLFHTVKIKTISRKSVFAMSSVSNKVDA